MLLAITTEYQPATNLGFLLHKHPDRFQTFDPGFGEADVFYTEASECRCTACLLLEVDVVRMVRHSPAEASVLLGHYVNDRPYVASSFMSVAISQVFGMALGGRCRERPQLATTPIPLAARLEVLPVRGGREFLQRVFEPLGYTVEAVRHPLDEQFPLWGESPYYSVTISATKRLSELLTHLYVLIPVFDNEKHYFAGEEELEKLLAKGTGWLASHPEKEEIARRNLKFRCNLVRQAVDRLSDAEGLATVDSESDLRECEQSLERPLNLSQQRRAAVLAVLRASGARTVLDLGTQGERGKTDQRRRCCRNVASVLC